MLSLEFISSNRSLRSTIAGGMYLIILELTLVLDMQQGQPGA